MHETHPLEITQMSIGELRPDPANPRGISDAELESLTWSIKQFGLVDPVITRKEEKVVFGGHQRQVFVHAAPGAFAQSRVRFDDSDHLELGRLAIGVHFARGMSMADADLSDLDLLHEPFLSGLPSGRDCRRA